MSENGTALSAIGSGRAIASSGANIVIATPANITAGFNLAGVTIAATLGGDVPIVTQGFVPPTVFSLGAGIACAVGVDVNGTPVRVTDATCVSGRHQLGWVDTGGTVYVSPQKRPWFSIEDYGAKGDGSTDDLPAFIAAMHAATTDPTSSNPNNHRGGMVYVPALTAPNSYFLNGDLIVDRPVSFIAGDSVSLASHGVRLKFAPGKGIIGQAGDSPTANTSNGTGSFMRWDGFEIDCSDVPNVALHRPGHVYNVGDKVRCWYDQHMYFECIAAGITAAESGVTTWGASQRYPLGIIVKPIIDPTTTIASESNEFDLSKVTTINVADTTGFSSKGYIFVTTATGSWIINYTGLTGTSFTGCSLTRGGGGAMSTGGEVIQIYRFILDSGPGTTGGVEPLWGTAPETNFSSGHVVIDGQGNHWKNLGPVPTEPSLFESINGALNYEHPWTQGGSVWYGSRWSIPGHPDKVAVADGVDFGSPGVRTPGGTQPSWNPIVGATTTETVNDGTGQSGGSVISYTTYNTNNAGTIQDGTVWWSGRIASGFLVRAGARIENCYVVGAHNFGITFYGTNLPVDYSGADSGLCSTTSISDSGGGLWYAHGESQANLAQLVNHYGRRGNPYTQMHFNAHSFHDGGALGNTFVQCQAQNDPTVANQISGDPRGFLYDYLINGVSSNTSFGGTNHSALIGCYSEGGKVLIGGNGIVVGGTIGITQFGSTAPSLEPLGGINITDVRLLSTVTDRIVKASMNAPISDTATGLYGWTDTAEGSYQVTGWMTNNPTTGWWGLSYADQLAGLAFSGNQAGDHLGVPQLHFGYYRGLNRNFEFGDTDQNEVNIRAGLRNVGDVVWRPDSATPGGTALDVVTTAGYEATPWRARSQQVSGIAPPDPDARVPTLVRPRNVTNTKRFLCVISGSTVETEPNWNASVRCWGDEFTETSGTVRWRYVGDAPAYAVVRLHTATTQYVTQAESIWTPVGHVRGYAKGYALQTTDNSVGVAASYPLPSNTTAGIDVVVRAYETSGTGTPDGATFTLQGAWLRVAGAPQQIQAPVVSVSNPNATGTAWTAVLALNSNSVEVHVTGDTGKTIQWACFLQSREAFA
jgi:hypothetical protein